MGTEVVKASHGGVMSELSLDKEGELSQGKLGGEDAKHIQYRLFWWFCLWNSFTLHKGQPPLKKELLFLCSTSVLWAWMFRYMLGDPNGHYFI